jgi:hypothetical protein
MSPAIRSYAAEAEFALTQSNSRLAISLLNTALRLLGKEPGADGRGFGKIDDKAS